MDNQVYVMTDMDGCVEAVYRDLRDAKLEMLRQLIDNYKGLIKCGDTHRFINNSMNPHDAAVDELEAIVEELDTLYTNCYVDDFLHVENAELK